MTAVDLLSQKLVASEAEATKLKKEVENLKKEAKEAKALIASLQQKKKKTPVIGAPEVVFGFIMTALIAVYFITNL